MPWNDTTKIMTGPLKINIGGDIQRASGENSGDLGTCFVNGNWKKWAKFKPERNQLIPPLTLEDRKENNFGLVITKFTTLEALRSGYSSQWAYIRPQVGDRFHHNDLLNPADESATGYNGNAACFFRLSASTFPKSYYRGAGGLTFRAQWEAESSVPGSIQRSEIRLDPGSPNSSVMSSMYFGVLLWHSAWSNPSIKTASSTIGTGTGYSDVTISDSELQNFPGTVEVYPVISPTALTSAISAGSTPFPSAGLFALPMSPFALQVKDVTSVVAFTANIQATYTRARVYLSGNIGMTSTGEITTLTGISYNVYAATSLTDTTGAQIGTTQSYSTPLTTTTTLPVDYAIQTTRPDFIRVVITGYASDTQFSGEFHFAVTNDEDIVIE